MKEPHESIAHPSKATYDKYDKAIKELGMEPLGTKGIEFGASEKEREVIRMRNLEQK